MVRSVLRGMADLADGSPLAFPDKRAAPFLAIDRIQGIANAIIGMRFGTAKGLLGWGVSGFLRGPLFAVVWLLSSVTLIADDSSPEKIPIVDSGALDAPALVLAGVEPVFPASLRRTLSAYAVVEVTVGRDGIPMEARVTDTSMPYFERNAVEAALLHRFSVGTVKGLPVVYRTQVRLEWHIRRPAFPTGNERILYAEALSTGSWRSSIDQFLLTVGKR